MTERTINDLREELQLDKLRAEVTHLIEEGHKSRVEREMYAQGTRKAKKEADWYMLVIGSGATLAIVAFVKLFL